MKFIVRLFPEISIKSRPVRNRMIAQLQQNIINAALHHNLTLHVFSQWDKQFVRCADEDRARAITQLSRIPGIHSFQAVTEFPFQNFDDIFAGCREILGPRIADKTFALRVRRRGKHSFTSQQAERILGGMFKAHYPNRGVNLSHPEVTLNIEIDQDTAFVIEESFKGLGGFPIGPQGEVMSLLSGGFDSGVSTYEAIRRGLRVHYLFFNMGGTAHELGVKQEAYFLWDRYASSHRVKFTTVPFEQVVGQILERVHHGVRGVILKRMMVKVGSRLCQKYDAQALVTGESVAQVSSQTLINLGHIDAASEVLVLRPLSFCDKQEIIDKATAIGTAGFAETMPEYCGVISDHPNVCPRRSFVEEEEAKLDADLVEKTLALVRTVDIRDIPEDTNRLAEEVEIEHELQPHEVVLDVRSPDDAAKAPLVLEGHSVICMPFYRTASDFGQLDKMKTYALYCDQGVMSLMQARQLKEMGHHNVKVWRPQAKTSAKE
ncbi:MAG: tRNA 4-thiouridine(8) synthase ThiI [Candidatus Anaerobiospirillum merdipullorum]|uniref:tRNA sulfurtransferase n=1 Tax=Candidatus Anaerobiospirillum merdipullorum TaxID=2838450 RepID=A0A9E2NTC1_9GAMM|nr:tRNA 4-thiouridine(8) synthase ThiI [Candidatus Anaerobiospirillum merdipullorum]